MTLSYRIIKNNNITVSPEGVEVSKNILIPTSNISEIQLNNEGASAVQGHFLTQEEKNKLIKEFQEELAKEKDAILKNVFDEAKAKAEKILNEAKDKGYNDGLESGYSDGYKDGYSEAQKQASEITEKANDILKSAHEEVKSYMEEEKENMVRLAARMAEVIVKQKIDESSHTVLEMVKPLLVEFRSGGTVIISCGSNIAGYIKENVHLLKNINKDLEFMIIEDMKLSENSFSLEYQNQIIDMNIERQIEEMVTTFLNGDV